MRIRKFRKEDARQVCTILRRSQREVLSKYYKKKVIDTFSKRITPKRMIQRAKEQEIFVAVQGKRILGINGITGNEVRRFHVDPDYHGNGIGRRLMQNIERIARKRRIKKLIVKSSTNAEKFYQKMGFKRVRRIVGIIGNVRFPEILMQKKL